MKPKTTASVMWRKINVEADAVFLKIPWVVIKLF